MANIPHRIKIGKKIGHLKTVKVSEKEAKEAMAILKKYLSTAKYKMVKTESDTGTVYGIYELSGA